MSTEFCVLDTEGSPILREVAVVDERGQLIFEARTPGEEDSYFSQDLVRPLPDLLRELRDLLRNRQVVAHNAAHDRAVLEASYSACGLQPPILQWLCTWELAQSLHHDLDSHTLGALCDRLGIGDEPFHRDAAHQAAYDARFTYLLFRRLQRDQLCRRLGDAPNPFSSSRVDTPFQHFADDRQVHRAAFQRLSAVLHSVAADANHQSQGAVLIGEPGAGKTHLVMRLAEEVLSSNRLLFIRQPTQAASVLFHIYSRTLESLVERVGEGPHSQLDLLLIRAIRRLYADASTERDREIFTALEAEDLERLGQEGSDARRQRWERIETRLLRWWADTHSASGFGRQILQGLLRFCRYSEPRRRESCRRWLATGEHEPEGQELEGLSPWNEEQRREEFSLQALQVLGRLCCLDQPLILVFDQLEGLWLEGNRPVLLRFGEVIKELFTHVPHALILVTLFPDRWQQFQNDFDGSITGRVAQHVIPLDHPRPDQIEEILNLRLEPLQVTALELFTSAELESIARQPSIRSCLNRAGAVFEHHVRGVPLPPPPPPPAVATHAEGGLVFNQRILRLEHQLGQILHRLARLEATQAPLGSSGTASSEPVAMPVPAPFPQVMEPAEVLDADVRLPSTQTVDDHRRADAEDSAYEDLFRRYRSSALDTLRQRWEQPQIIDDSDDAGKLRQICLGYQQIRPLDVQTLRLGNRRVPDNVLIKTPEAERCVAFLHVANANSVGARLGNFNQLVLRHRQVQFILMRDASAPAIRSRSASQALEAFKNGSGDGRQRTFLRPLDQERRVALEFVHQLVSNILNRELDLPLRKGLDLLARHEPGNWVVKLLHPVGAA
jgi:Cdc6-like AAA superfamily ATPase